jgi:thymidylate synthase (FAD)
MDIKVTKQSVTPLQGLNNAEARLRMLEQIGRVCYKSEDRITFDSYKTFLKMIIKKGHETILEHWSATFKIITSVAIARELMRHRLASFTQESTRYVNYKKTGYEIIANGIDNTVSTLADFEHYEKLLELGHKPEIARDYLPLCLKTELVMSCNMRELRHILKLRLSKAAHPQMRELMNLLFDYCKTIPVLFDDIVESIQE